MRPPSKTPRGASPLSFRPYFGSLAMVGAFSGLINAAMLAGSIYMLQVYDRVLSSRSVPTLIGISLLLFFTYLLQGLLDAVRARMLARIGASFDGRISPLAFAASRKLPLMGASSENALQPLRDVDAIRSFLASIGPTALFDLPWMPIFFVGCFLLHPWLGWLAVAGGGVIVLIALLSESTTRKSSKDLMESGSLRRSIADASRRNAEVLAAMGMGAAFDGNWQRANARHLRNLIRSADAMSGISSFAKIFRIALQSAILGLGAYLVIRGDTSPGAMIAASIMTSRAMAPIETAVANWRGFVAARQGYARLAQILGDNSFGTRTQTTLPAPELGMEVDGLIVRAPGRQNTILDGVSFQLQAGSGLGVIGPSGSGKSTLARTLVGAWSPLRGEVRLDGAALHQWEAANLGRHIGYLPQDIELFDGTVAENIARFGPDASDETIIAAAKAAGAHGMIVKLDNGYDTRIGEDGTSLSGGQRQRIGLARALYGAPFLVVLDEPNSNLDHAGDEALNFAIKGIRARGGIVVIITHRPAAIAGVDQIAILADGRLQAIGPRDQILKNVVQQSAAPGAQRQSLVS